MNRRGFFQTFLAGIAAWASSKLPKRRYEPQDYEGRQPFPFDKNRAFIYDWKSREWRRKTRVNEALYLRPDFKITSEVKQALRRNYSRVSDALARDSWMR